MDTWGPVGEVISLWLNSADSQAQWTQRLIRRLEAGAFPMPVENNALAPWTSRGRTGVFIDAGPGDHGAMLEWRFPLGPGESKTFYLYYGAAVTEAAAIAAVNAVGAQVWSFGQPSSSDGRTLGIPNTFIFGFKDPAPAPAPSPTGPSAEPPARPGGDDLHDNPIVDFEMASTPQGQVTP